MSDEIEQAASGQEVEHGRRDLLGKAAMVAAVSTAVGLGLARKASAVNNDPILIGASEDGTLTTNLTGGTALQVTNGNSLTIAGKMASIIGVQTVSNRVGVMGHATGTATSGWAVYGRNTTTTGRGVFGLNVGSSGLGVYGLNSGVTGIGVYGEHNATTSGTGVLGVSNFGVGVDASGSTIGVRGVSTAGVGVDASGPTIGVRGVSNLGVGVDASGSTFDVRAFGSGRVLFGATGVTNPPTTGTVGTVARDAAGNMWVAVAADTWRKLAGPATAGAFHAITPTRVYDSRAPAPTPGALTTGNNRLISVADGRDLTTGAPSSANIVPAGATAIACNLTVSDTVNQGFLTVNPGGNIVVTASTINWSASGQILANGIIATLNATRQLTVIAGGGGSTHFIIDVSGYFL